MDRRTFVKWSSAATAGMLLKAQSFAQAELQPKSSPSAADLNAASSDYDRSAVGLGRPEKLSLDGEWNFKEDPDQVGEKQEWYRPGSVRGRVGLVPLPWQIAFPEIRDFKGTGWYERTLQIPADFAEKRVVLASYGISDLTRVWVNGQSAGEGRGAFAPFALDITSWVRPGTENTITIRASDPAGSAMDYNSLIHCSGLWQSIWLEATGRTYVADIFMVPDIDHSRAAARIAVLASEASPKERPLRLDLVVKAPNGKHFTAGKRVELASGSTDVQVTVPVELHETELWEIGAPRLYQVQATLTENGKVLDQASVDFGMRKIETRGDRFYLNNKPIYLVGGGFIPGPGWGDCDWHHPPPYHNPTDEETRKSIAMIKSTGVNWVRVPMRPAPVKFLYWADRMGLLVWQGGPWTLGQPVKGDKSEQYKKWLAALILRDHNHPSLVMWEMMNEGAGNTRETLPELTAQLYSLAKSLDETRLILDNSGGWSIGVLSDPGNHGKTDVDDWHNYPPFDEFDDTRKLIGSLRSYGRPLVVSEFGPIPYIFNVDKVKKKWGGALPWWTEPGSTGGWESMVKQAGLEQRFLRWNLDKVYGDFTAFTDASDWYYFEGLKQQTDWMRINPQVTGHVVWMFDSTPHPIGVFDYFNDKKAFCSELPKIWGQNVVVVDIAGRRNFWVGEMVQANLYLSHFGDHGPLEGNLRWSMAETNLGGNLGRVSVPAGQVKQVGSIAFPAPDLDRPNAFRLVAEVERNGTTVSQNYATILVVPPQYRVPKLKSVIFRGDFPWEFEALGYELKANDASAPVVTTKINEEILGFLEAGKTVLLLACGDWVIGAPRLVDRKVDPSIRPFLTKYGLGLGGKSQGGHGDCFFIKKGGGLFDAIPFTNPITWAFQQAWPEQVVVGVNPEHHADLLAGAYGMAIQSRTLNAEEQWTPGEVNATILQCRYGKGRLIISTFELLARSINDDPVATIMLNDLINYANSAFEPTLRLA